ncbi:MAG: hypothetical protein GX444_18810 [Myxococcales bacterium]|nr:hypothetical protein [Myxococcales bacterium]
MKRRLPGKNRGGNSRPAAFLLLFFLLLLGILAAACSSESSDDDDQAAGDDDASPADDDTAADDDDNDNDDNDDNDDSADDDTGDDDSGDDDDNDDDDDDNDDNDNDNDDSTVEPIHLDLVEGCNYFMTSSECYLPYPSAFFQVEDPTSPTGVRVNLPDEFLPTGIMPSIDMGPTNTADGISPAGPILVHFGTDIAEEFLTGQNELYESYFAGNPLALFNYETGNRVIFMSEMDMNRRALFQNRYALIVRPLEPMEMGQRHVMVLTNDLTDTDGNPLESPPAFAALRDQVITDNPEIEAIRPHYEEIFAFLEAHGYPRSSLLLAWDFMVASKEYLTGSVLSMRETALEEAGGTGLGYTITSVQDDPNQYLARIVEGDFEVPNYLTADNELVYDENHHPIRQAENAWFPYTMIIPKKAETLGQPLPLVVFGHGIFGNGRDYLTSWPGTTIHQWAEETGVIMIATDWIGLSDGDLDLIINDIMQDLNRISIVTDRLQQSLVNNIVLTELALGDLEEDPAIQIDGHDLIDDTRVYYYGVSLGGIMGSSFVSISNRIERGVLAVPGSVWLNLIPRSVVWVPIKVYMDLLYPDPLLQQKAIAIFQTRFDMSDPITLTRLMFREPLPDAPAGRQVLLQEAIGDCEVPNLTTEMLSRSIGVELMTPSIHPVFGLDEVTSPVTAGGILTQYDLVDLTQQYMPPESNIPPEVDNGVHTDMCFQTNVLEQVATFTQTGQVVQYCAGPCDPD